MDIKAAAGTEIYRHQKKKKFLVLTDDGAREGVGVIQRGASAEKLAEERRVICFSACLGLLFYHRSCLIYS